MKVYTKPELYYENLELSQHIAGNCTMKVNLIPSDATDGGCTASGTLVNALFPEGQQISNGFSTSDTDCTDPYLQMYCYENSNPLMGVHSS